MFFRIQNIQNIDFQFNMTIPLSFLRWFWVILCACLLTNLAIRWTEGAPIQTQLNALLPQSPQHSILQAAQTAEDRQFNQQILMLVGAENSETAFQAASQVAQQAEKSGLFTAVDSRIEPDLNALKQSVHQLGIATLPHDVAQQLHQQPQAYFQARAEDAVNPFSGSLLSLEDDWLGVSRFMWKNQHAALTWHNEHHMLYTEYQGKTWVYLRAHLLDTPPPATALLSWWQNQKQSAQAHTLLATGGALFAADAKLNAERESSLMSALGASLTILFLFWIFKTWRIVYLLLPLMVGLLVGVSVSVMVLGEIHALTLVIGTSLIGVLVDFPLHWLAPTLFHQHGQWDAPRSMQRVLPSFTISLTITALGYIMLWWTPLPILQQTALFSVAALMGAFATTVLWLPPLFAHAPLATQTSVFHRVIRWWSQPKHSRIWLISLIILGITLLFGVSQSRWQDDIRDWASMRPDLLDDAKKISQISQLNNEQTIVFTAPSADELLQQSRTIAAQLPHNTRALHQWILPENEQISLKKQLAKLATQPENYTPLLHLGVPAEHIQAALREAANAPTVSLSDSLTLPQAAGFQPLYLGKVDNKWVGLLKWSPQTHETKTAFRLPEHAILLDKRTQLNQQFAETRNQAAYLKLLSFGLAAVGLVCLLGWRRGGVILLLPILALLGTVGVLAYLNVVIGLFAMFGLLLAAAIGVDYAVYALTAPESVAARMAGMSLAACTTGFSFVLLAWSRTPAVAAFGLSVFVGVVLNYVLVMSLLRFRLLCDDEKGNANSG